LNHHLFLQNYQTLIEFGYLRSASGDLYLDGKLYDVNNAAGTSGQVLSSTGAGINWVGSGSLPGGPYLPLAGGTMTGTNGVLMPDSFELKLGTGDDAQIKHDGSHLFIDNSVGSTYLRNTSTNAPAAVPLPKSKVISPEVLAEVESITPNIPPIEYSL